MAIANEQQKHFETEMYSEIISGIKEMKWNKAELMRHKLLLAKRHGVKGVPSDIQVLMHAADNDLDELTPYLLSKPVRTQSGVAIVAVMTAPHSCPHGKCTFCPGGPGSHFGDVPQSYTGNEPATMRGIRNNYDGYLQVWNRLEQYIVMGQPIDKVEVIVMGGTFPAQPKAYKRSFITDVFRACNDFSRMMYSEEGILDIRKFKEFFELPGNVQDAARTGRIHEKLISMKAEREPTLEGEQHSNERAKVRVVALCIETKPDWCMKTHINEILSFGTTRVEVGIQTLKDEVLALTHRGHDMNDAHESTRLMKDALLKVTYHIMPGLPGTSKEEDVGFFRQLFEDEALKPDALKIYPCMVMPGTPLYEEFKQGKFTPLTTEQAAEIIAEGTRFIPEYCRVMRVQRDIPTKYAMAGVDRNNLRQLVDVKLAEKNIVCKCIRCKEIKLNAVDKSTLRMKRLDYNASGSTETFLYFEDSLGNLAGFCRLRHVINPWRPEFTKNSAGVRELHVYSRAMKLGSKDQGKSIQHQGLGKELMKEAERIAKEEWSCDKILVISGIGVKEYYEKLGYTHDGVYMSKTF